MKGKLKNLTVILLFLGLLAAASLPGKNLPKSPKYQPQTLSETLSLSAIEEDSFEA
jgi:hypothetical protein